MNGPWPRDPAAVARAVLADPRFRNAQPAPHKRLLDLVYDALSALWRQLTAPLLRALGDHRLANAIGVAVLVVVVAGIGVAAARVLARRRRVRRSEGRPPARSRPLDDAQPDAAALFAQATAAARDGRWHAAAALLWASALRRFDESGRVPYDPARTPGEWRRLVGEPAFDAFARDAVRALFGADADAVLVERMRRTYGEFSAE